MNEYLVYAGIVLGTLFLALLVPGLRVLAEPIVKGLIEIVFELLKHKGSFVIWFFKTLYQDHLLVFKHMCQAKDSIDPTQRVRDDMGP